MYETVPDNSQYQIHFHRRGKKATGQEKILFLSQINVYFDHRSGALTNVCLSKSSFMAFLDNFIYFSVKKENTLRRVYQCLGATPICWKTPKCWSTPGENISKTNRQKNWSHDFKTLTDHFRKFMVDSTICSQSLDKPNVLSWLIILDRTYKLTSLDYILD